MSDETSSDVVVVFSDVSLNGGKPGSLKLTDADIIFEKKGGIRVSKEEWPLEAVVETVMKPVTASVILHLEMGEFKDTLSFRMGNLSELTKFRQALDERLTSGSERSGDDEVVAAVDPQQQQQQQKTTSPPPPLVPFPPAKKEDDKDDTEETAAVMSQSERTYSSRPGVVRVDGASNDPALTKGRRQRVSVASSVGSAAGVEAVRGMDMRVSAKTGRVSVASNNNNNKQKTTGEQQNSPSPPPPPAAPEGAIPLRDIVQSDESSLDDASDISDFAGDENDDDDMMMDQSSNRHNQTNLHASMNASSRSRGSAAYGGGGRRRETVTLASQNLPKDLLTPTDHQKSLNESVHMSASASSHGGVGRRRGGEMNSSVRSSVSTSRRSTVGAQRGLRQSEREKEKERSVDSAMSGASAISSAASANSEAPLFVGSQNPAAAAANETRRSSKLPGSVNSTMSDHSASSHQNRLSMSSRSQREVEKSQAKELAQATAKEYMRVISEKSEKTLFKEEQKSQTSSVVSAQQSKLEKFEANMTTPTTNLRNQIIAEKSAEWKSAELKSSEMSLRSAEEGRQTAMGSSVDDPYNIGLVEARVVGDESGFLRPSAVASQVDLEQEELARKRLLCRFGGFCGCVLVVVIVLAALAGVGIIGGGTTETVVMEPPSLTPEERLALIQERISNVVYDPASLEEPDTPQRQALDWLVHEDKFYEDIVEVDATLQEKLEQRFTLAVFYFTMSQANRWPYCRPPETGEVMACVHHVLESYANEGVYFDQKMSEPAFRWLSNTDECSWAGVKCRDGMHVSHLQLAGYPLQGTLPIEIGYLRSMEVLDLQKCGLVGSLPVEWGALETDNSALQSIRLDNNLLSGTIPEEWCDLNSASLKNVVLSNNQLTGTIPACLSKFTELENFSVMNNELSGIVPEMGTLLHLKSFHVAGNNLNGAFPRTLCNLKRYEMKEASADCKNDQSEFYVDCPCCTKCCDGDDQGVCSLEDDMLKDEP